MGPIKQAALALERLATLEERKRCATIARNLISTDRDWDTSYWNQACERIAMAIERDR